MAGNCEILRTLGVAARLVRAGEWDVTFGSVRGCADLADMGAGEVEGDSPSSSLAALRGGVLAMVIPPAAV